MRNLLKQKFLLSALAIGILLVGCKKKEVDPKKEEETPTTFAKPTVTVAAKVKGKDFASGGSVAKGDTIAFTVDVNAPGGFTSLEIFKGTKSLKKHNRTSLKLGAGAKEAKNVTWDYFTASEQGDITLKFTVIDSVKKSSSVEFKFKVSKKPDVPTATVTAKVKKQNFQSGGDVTKGDTVVFTANVNAPGKFASLEVFKAGASVKKFAKLTEAKNVVYEYYTVNDQEGSDVVLKFTVTDALKQSNSTEFKFKVKKSVADSPQPKPVKLYAPTSDNKSKTFFQVGFGPYSISELDGEGDEPISSELMDFGYFYGGDTKGASIVSCKQYEAVSSVKFPATWKIKKDCKFSAVLSSIDKAKFDGMKEGDDVKNAIKGKTIDKSSITGLKEGDVFAFKTIDDFSSFSGLMKISKLKKGTGSDGFIEIVVKLNEKQASGGGGFGI